MKIDSKHSAILDRFRLGRIDIIDCILGMIIFVGIALPIGMAIGIALTNLHNASIPCLITVHSFNGQTQIWHSKNKPYFHEGSWTFIDRETEKSVTVSGVDLQAIEE
jgi:hypothetical protein